MQLFRTTDVSVNVLAGHTAQPDDLGLFAIDLSSFAVTELISPTLQSAAWAEGATPAGSLDSTGLFVHPNEGVAGVSRLADHFLYWRTIADGPPTAFVGPFRSGSARELALFPSQLDASAYKDPGPTESIRRGLRPPWSGSVRPA